jgi:hypothetical protein
MPIFKSMGADAESFELGIDSCIGEHAFRLKRFSINDLEHVEVGGDEDLWNINTLAVKTQEELLPLLAPVSVRECLCGKDFHS